MYVHVYVYVYVYEYEYMHVTETHGDRDTWIQRHIEAHRDI